MMQRLGITILLAASLTLSSQPARGLGGGVTNGGAFTMGAADDTGVREWVSLVKTGDVLSGWPQHPLIALITVYAPEVDQGHLILRELTAPDGRRSLLLSAPASLAQRTHRVTLYVQHHTTNMVLLEYEEGRWRPRRPQPMVVTREGSHGASQDHLLAFTVAGLGFYWLLDQPVADVSGSSARLPQEPSASALVGGGLSRGILPWIWSVLVLLAGWIVSHLLHRREQRAGR